VLRVALGRVQFPIQHHINFVLAARRNSKLPMLGKTDLSALGVSATFRRSSPISNPEVHLFTIIIFGLEEYIADRLSNNSEASGTEVFDVNEITYFSRMCVVSFGECFR